MKILLHETRRKPLMELPKTLSPLTMLRALVLIVFTCVIQLSHGVKNMPRYRMDEAGLMVMSVLLGSHRWSLVGGIPCRTSCLAVTLG